MVTWLIPKMEAMICTRMATMGRLREMYAREAPYSLMFLVSSSAIETASDIVTRTSGRSRVARPARPAGESFPAVIVIVVSVENDLLCSEPELGSYL